MSDAQERLARALDALEAQVGRQLAAHRSSDDLRREVETLAADRSRLAQELDGAQANLARLDAVAGHAEDRVTAAMGTIERLLGGR